MLFTQRQLWFAVRWIFPALVVVVLGAASAAPPQQSFTVAQLSIELGSKKSGKHKCPKSDPECQQGWNNEQEREKHKNKSLKRQLLELGVGEAIDGAARSTKTKKKVKKGGASATTEKNKKGGNKIAKPGKKPGGDPKDKPVFVPPEFPALAMQDCEDCYELWDSILWYEFIISVDARKLFDRRRDLEDRRAEMEELRSRLGGAGSIDKVYYSQEIERHSEYIEAIEKLNAELEQLIAKEWAILRERMDQYVECAGHYCPILVKTEQVELVPAGPPATTEPPPADPAPSEPLASGTTYDWTTTTKLGLGYEPKYGGYTPTEPTTYGPTVPRLRPPEGDRKVCGPDVTPAVIKTLKKIREDFNASPEKQTAACRSLIDPRTGGVAWDIDKLSPAVAVPQVREKENPFSYEKEYDAWVQRDEKGGIKSWKQPWFTGESHMCAIPRNDPVCAPTVEFFGICEHAQVVNYVQWRFMLGLCGGAYPYVGPLLHKAWNTIEYGGNAPKQAQDNMSEVAEKILDKLEDDETDFSDIKDALVDLDSGLTKEIRQCELKCLIKIDREFDYKWLGLKEDRPVETLRLDRDLNKMAESGMDKLKAKAEAAGFTADSLRPSNVLDQILKSLGVN